MVKKITQKGFLLISAVMLMVVVGFMAATAVYLYTTSQRATADQNMTTQALYIASAGVESGLSRLIGPAVSNRLSCAAINGHADFTNVTLGNGEFTVTTTTYSPITSLTATISAVSTIIPLTSISGFASEGSIMIDKEIIDYANTSTDSVTCGGAAPCLSGATRGVSGTTAIGHTSGTPVGQDACELVSTGWVPSEANPLASRTVKRLVSGLNSGVQSVGQQLTAPSDENIREWNGSSWDTVTRSIPTTDYNAIDILSFADGWAVGQTVPSACPGNNDAVMIRWNGTGWDHSNAYCSNSSNHLSAVYCLSANYCWAVGQAGTFVLWNGSSWSKSNNIVDNSGGGGGGGGGGQGQGQGGGGQGGIAGWSLNDVYCNSTTDCWAVGDKTGGKVLIVRYNGTEWASQESPLIQNSVQDVSLEGVYCVNSSYCWAVGDQRSFAFWNGSVWAGVNVVVLPSNVKLNDVSCSAENDCWAVGERTAGKPSFIHWAGSSWSNMSSIVDGTVQNQDMNSIFCIGVAPCWAVGEGPSANFYNGSTWTNISTGLGNREMRGVSGLPGDGPRLTNWQEVFN